MLEINVNRVSDRSAFLINFVVPKHRISQDRTLQDRVAMRDGAIVPSLPEIILSDRDNHRQILSFANGKYYFVIS